jgi:methyl acetate hydrolase
MRPAPAVRTREEPGVSTTTRSGIDEVLERAVADSAVPSVTAIAADRDGVIYEGAAGPRVAGQSEPVSVDSHYSIMSMTKMLATTVALQLREQGRLDFDAAVAHYCPAFAALQVLEGFDGDTPRLRPPATAATVGQLVTHTAGLSYWFWNADIVRWQELTGTPHVMSGLNVIFTAPLVADPGTRFEYGINLDWLGRVIETASGTTLDEAIRTGITEPLGMAQTGYLMSSEQRANFVPCHLQGDDGAWTATDIDLNQTPEYWAGGHGLYSTPRDYLTFQRMLLGNGTSPGGVTILAPETVDAAFTNRIGDFDFPAHLVSADPASSADFDAGPGFKWGYGLLLNTDDIPGHRRAGSGAWAGLLNTHFWVDRATGITGAIYSQFLPFASGPAIQMYQDFEAALYAAL